MEQLHSGHGILLLSLTRYESSTLVHFRDLAPSDTPNRCIPGWHSIVPDLEMLAGSPYVWKRQIRMFIECFIQSGYREPTMPSSA